MKLSDRYPSGYDLERFLRANAPQIVFLSIEDLAKAKEMLRGIEETLPGCQVVAIDRACDPQVLLNLMQVGVRECLAYPFESQSYKVTINRLAEQLDKRPAKIEFSDNVFCFPPSKAGAGATTIALNTAVAMSRMPDSHVLMMDLDLNSGLVGFMLKLDNVYTIYEAAENASKLDEHPWPQLVASIGKLDVLPAGRLDSQTHIDPMQVRQLVSFARQFYSSICIDLSGNMEKFFIEVMQDCKKVCIVCTPGIPSLHLARQKLSLLQSMDLGDKVSILMNRAQKRPIISTVQIQSLLGVPVYQEFPNDYRGVHNALTTGREIDSSTELGKQFTQLSHSVLEQSGPKLGAKKKKNFLEYFTVTPTRA
ncbi:MAG: hypothetical protein FJW31_02510 [Acidobacteria bacterium]|nr:hypothetical protein [Acidobacteriota bacterium]